jgi:hypothetical protein
MYVKLMTCDFSMFMVTIILSNYWLHCLSQWVPKTCSLCQVQWLDFKENKSLNHKGNVFFSFTNVALIVGRKNSTLLRLGFWMN